MSRLCFSDLSPNMYAAFGKSLYGFKLSEDRVQQILTIPGFTEDVRIVVEGPEGFLAVSSGKSFSIVDPARPREAVLTNNGAHLDTIYAMHFNLATGLLLSSGKDKELKIWHFNAQNRELTLLVSVPTAHDDWIIGLDLDVPRSLVFSAGIDGLVKVWFFERDAGTLTLLTTSPCVHSEGILALRYSSTKGVALSAGRDGCLRCWRITLEGLRLLTFAEEVHCGWSRAVQFHGPSGFIVSGGDDGMVHVQQLAIDMRQRGTPGCTEDAEHEGGGSSATLTSLARQEQAHEGAILALQFSAAQSLVVSGGDDGSIRAFCFRRGQASETTVSGEDVPWELQPLAQVADAHDGGAVVALQLGAMRKNTPGANADPGRIVVSAGSDGRIRIWCVDEAAGVFKPVAVSSESQGSGILAIQFDSSANVVLGAAVDGAILSWLLEGDSLTLRSRLDGAHRGRIFALKYDASSGILLSAGMDKAIRAWRHSGQGDLSPVGSTVEPLTSGVLTLHFDAASGTVLSSGMDGRIRAWALQGESLLPDNLEMSASSDGILALEYDVASGVVVSVGIDGSIKAWIIERTALTPPLGGELQCHDGWIRAMHFDVKSQFVATCGDDGAVRAWCLDGNAILPCGTALDAHWDGARGVLVDGKMRLVLSAGDDGAIKAWRIQDRSMVHLSIASEAHDSVIFGVRFDEASRIALSASMNGVIKAWRLGEENNLVEVATNLRAPRSGILAIRFDAESSTVLSAGIDGAIRTWRLEDGELSLEAATDAHSGMVRALEFDAKLRMAVSGGEDGVIRVWRLQEDGNLSAVAMASEGHNEVCAMSFHGPSSLVASAGDEGEVRVWRINGETLDQVAVVVGAHSGGVVKALQLVVSKGDDASALLVSAGTERTICVWKVEGNSLSLLTQETRSGGVLAFDLDFSTHILFGALAEGGVRAWMLLDGGSRLALLAKSPDGEIHKGGALAVHYGGDSGVALTVGKDRSLRAWHLAGGRTLSPVTVATRQFGSEPFKVSVGSRSC
eukprot:TRINITY_DN42302_c0_g1_i1.p1 TRINITY_DN42302_c0_g1~~TRINITY_DN42302_c0_g1_i1.p1  ORF type:complete len:1017 (-),score=164.21 TRINITY_DN42302_c0_g1_i1:101-3151(-)